MIICIFGFLKKTVNLGRDLVIVPISVVQDIVDPDSEDFENTSNSLDDVGEDIGTLLDDEED